MTLFVTDTLTAVQCPTCGVHHAIPETLREQALAKRGANGKQVYCPNGHTWHYTGKTEAERLAGELERAQQQRAWAEARANRLRAEAEAERRKAAAYKGVATKAKRRAAAAACPCCNRTFVQLRRHLDSQHPEYVAEVMTGADPT